MYRVHFTSKGLLHTERATLEISPAGFRWHFRPLQAGPQVGAAIPPLRCGNGMVVKDYAHRWPAWQRRRLLRRWKAELLEAAALMGDDLEARWKAIANWLIPEGTAPSVPSGLKAKALLQPFVASTDVAALMPVGENV